jgi:hypothetical protein
MLRGELVQSKKLLLSGVVLFVLFYPFVGSIGASSTMWNQTYGGATDDEAMAVVQTSDGGYAIAGYMESFGSGNHDFWLLKTDEHDVIPEFPSWIILPLVLIVTLGILLLKKRLITTSVSYS